MADDFYNPEDFDRVLGHDKKFSRKEEDLISWVMEHVHDWERHRDDNYEERWDEYYRLWRGIWDQSDKTRQSERSKLISPALQQAIEATVAELEEGVFGRGKWFDIIDNYSDRRTDFQSPEERDKIAQAQQLIAQSNAPQQQKQAFMQQLQAAASQRKTEDVEHLKNLMMERYEEVDIKTALRKIFINGALYGTGIGKVCIESVPQKRIDQDPESGLPTVVTEETIQVFVDPVSPSQFAIDPSATTISEALGCSHRFHKPLHDVTQKQIDGIYKDDVDLESMSAEDHLSPTQKHENFEPEYANSIEIIEYCGLVPNEFIVEDDEVEDDEEPEEEGYTEAIITIANESILLRAVKNPYLMEDRPFIAYQHDTVPDSFWGRGVAEKGYNPQKALDAELRARMDGLALSVHPMLAVDATKRPRGTSYTVSPGKTIFTNGDPRESLMPFNFGDINSKTFQNASDLERMVQMATGAMDSATPLDTNRRNETASGMSMMMGGAIKRSKRTLANIESNFVKPLLKKSAWRWMQFDSRHFPMKDLSFLPHGSLGIMARELEQQQLIQLLSTVPAESSAFAVILKSIYENTSLSNKEELIQSVEQMMQPDPMQQQIQQIKMAQEMGKVQESQARVAENRADAFKAIAEARKTMEEANITQDKLDVEVMKEILDVVANQQQQEKHSITAIIQEIIRQRSQSQQQNGETE